MSDCGVRSNPGATFLLRRSAPLVSVVSLILVLLGGSPPAYAESTGSISGTVTLTGAGAPGITYMRACLSPADSVCTYVNSDGAGNYILSGLAVGYYGVAISTTAYGNIYYDQARGYNEATLVSVVAGQVSSGIDFIAAPAATISGVVTNNAGSPLLGITACATIPGVSSGNCGNTNAYGEYSISGLIAGTHRVQFNVQYTTSNGYASEYWNGVSTSDFATLISVTAGQTVTGVDASLSEGVTISGTITAPSVVSVAGIQICAYLTSTNCSTTDVNGDYVTQVPSDGEYTVYFPGSIDLAYRRYGQLNHADPILKVSTSQSTPATGIDIELLPGGGISGTLTKESDGSPLSGLFVCFYIPGVGSNGAPCGLTGSDGTYTNVGVPVATYVAFLGEVSAVYGGFYFGNSPSTSNRTEITVSEGVLTPNINGALPLKGAWPSSITWAPTNTTVSAPLGTLTPNQTATTNSWAGATYALSNAGTTGCTVAQLTGVITFTGAGTCQVSAITPYMTGAASGAYSAAALTIDFTITRATQTVSWAPTNTGVTGTSGTVTPSALASRYGDGAVTYSIVDSGATGCTINSTTAVITYSGVGTCQVQASAAQSAMYEAGSRSVTFTFTVPSAAPSTGGGGSSGGGDGGSETTAPTITPTPTTSEVPVPSPTATIPIAVPPFEFTSPSSVTASEVSAISPEQIATVAPEVFRTLAPAALRGITPDQAELLTTDQVRNIRPSGAAQLRPATVAALAPANITAMRPTSIARLTPNAVLAMSEEQIQAISPNAVVKMTSLQLKAMSPDQISSMTSSQLNAFSDRQVKAFTKAQVSALSKGQRRLLGL